MNIYKVIFCIIRGRQVNSKKKKAVVSFSGGKDSILSLYRAINNDYDICGLLVTFNGEKNSCFHEIPYDVLKKISDSINVPLIDVDCSKWEMYETEFEKELRKIKKKEIDTCIFGDIDIKKHRLWGEQRCINAGLQSYFPLWNEDRQKLTNEVIELGFEAIIKKVNLHCLSEDFLGRKLDKALVSQIKKCGSDPCGENGEYHTLVVNGPIFTKKIEIEILGRKIDNNSAYLQII